MNGPSQRWNGSWMISRSAKSSSRNGSTWPRSAGPPRFIMTMPVLTLLIDGIYPAARRRPGGSGHRLPACPESADEPFLQRDLRQPRHGVHVQLPHQAFPVAFHRSVADAELLRDLLVGPAFR